VSKKTNLRSALLIGAAAIVTFTTSAPAADVPETVIVTGSRIGSAATEALAAAPLSIISADDITNSKTVTIEQILNKLPEMGQQGSNDQNSISPGGISTVDLRALGSQRTLILINGQRMVDTFVNGGQGQDLSNVPVSMIERMEVLKDGASPIYGADAIGGVINIITRKDFNGFELTAGAGISGKSDHFTKQLSGTFGIANDRGSLLIGLEYYTEDPVRQRSRSWAHDATQPISYFDAGRLTYSYAVPEGFFIDLHTGQYLSGTPGGGITDWNYNLFNTGFEPDLIQSRAVLNANFTAEYNLTNNVTLFAESYFTNRKSTARLNPEPIGTGYTTAKYLDGTSIPGNAGGLCPAVWSGPCNPANTTGHNLYTFKRLFEVGDRIFGDNVNTYQMRAGAKGKLDDFTWDVGYMYGESDGNDYEHNAVNITRMHELIGALPCGAGAPAGCGSVTLFGTDSMTPEQAAYVRFTSSAMSKYVQQIAFVDVAGELPFDPFGAGNVGVAVGYNWRSEAVLNVPDAVSQSGDNAESNSLETRGQYHINELYAETKIPLAKDLPFAKDASLDIAARYSHYNNFGDSFVYKGSLNWAITDWIRFRGDYGTGFRAPQVGHEMYLGDTASADGYTDPCDHTQAPSGAVLAACQASFAAVGVPYNPATFTQQLPQLTAIWQGTPTLKPETSRQYNLGIVLTPDEVIPGLAVTVDYYNIRIKNVISQLSVDQGLFDCYASGIASACALFAPRSATGQLVGYSEPFINLGLYTTDGVDFGVNYATDALAAPLQLPDGSTISTNLRATYMNSNVADGQEYAGRWTTGAISTALPKWKAFMTVSLDIPDLFTFTWDEQFVGETVESLGDSAPPGRIPALFFTDISLVVPYQNYTATFGIANLFDKDPPVADDGYVRTVSNQYDFTGRFFFLKVKAKL
jgi:iron complex outermembrane recepter protein